VAAEGAGVIAPVETFQVTWELDQLLAIYERLAPAHVLEVGCWKGGTLWHWLQQPDTDVVAVDDQMRESDDWQDWALEAGSTLHQIQGDSRHPDIIEAAREHGPYDFVFIDGDHSYEAVRADVDNYGTMVADGGVLVLHDILPRPGYGVSRVWSELKSIAGIRYMEIAVNGTAPGNEGPCGIGVLWV
jgi:cephalosporin hydroxylase